MNRQYRHRWAAPTQIENLYGEQLRVPSRRDQDHVCGIQLHESNLSPTSKDKVLAWPADTSSQVAAGPEIRSSIAPVPWESAVMVHELRQPLSAIVSNAEANLRWLTLETPNLDAALDTAKKIIRDARAAADLMERLRNLFRGSGPQKAKVDINALIFEVLCRLADRIDERRIAVKTSTAADSVFVNGDRTQLEQVLQNLISNAIDAMEETSPIDRMLFIHSCQGIEGAILVTVEDRGCGLDNVERIFDPFFSTKANGLGLGLWICRSIIQSNMGKLWAEKVCHGGTKFSFTVPAH
jgi:two-component system, LuxR family, sensor kinase FixL